MKNLLIVILVLSISACTPTITRTPSATPESIHVSLSPAVLPMREALHACAKAHPEIALFLWESPTSSLEAMDASVHVRMGAPPDSPAITLPLAQDEIRIIVHPENPIQRLSGEDLRGIFSGKVTEWSDLGRFSEPIQVWIYPDGDELRQTFDPIILASDQNTSQARLAPDPKAMLQAISADEAAIGYLPKSWLTEDVKGIELDEALVESLTQPVLAMTEDNPKGAALILLSCLQGVIGKEEIGKLYEMLDD